MDAATALAWLFGLQPRGIRLELDRLRAALALRGDPHRDLRVIHVAGTNGKGSVCAMLESALRASGARVGLYTSPHLHHFGERIRVDGAPLGSAELLARLVDLRAFLDTPGAPALTFFEVATLLAFEVFRDAGCEVVVLEVGLGGRLDATNVIEDKLLTLITSISIDHQAYLGDSLEEIAGEKAGILRAGVPCVTSAQGRALSVVRERASALGAPLWELSEAPAPQAALVQDQGAALRVSIGDDTLEATPPLPGAHQRRNTALVLAALLQLKERWPRVATPRALAQAVERTSWPGRLEQVGRAPRVIVDAAHNAEGAAALAQSVAADPSRPRVLVFGAMADKDWRAMLDVLGAHFDARVYCAPDMPRAARPESFNEYLPGEVCVSPSDALERARRLAGSAGVVYVAGSIFVVAEARARMLGLDSGPPIPM